MGAYITVSHDIARKKVCCDMPSWSCTLQICMYPQLPKIMRIYHIMIPRFPETSTAYGAASSRVPRGDEYVPVGSRHMVFRGASAWLKLKGIGSTKSELTWYIFQYTLYYRKRVQISASFLPTWWDNLISHPIFPSPISVSRHATWGDYIVTAPCISKFDLAGYQEKRMIWLDYVYSIFDNLFYNGCV